MSAASPRGRTGFTDVDASGRVDDLVAFLRRIPKASLAYRRVGYEMMGMRPGISVLDVGCGLGEVCVEMAAMAGPGARIVGVDSSLAMVEAAGRTVADSGSGVELRRASIYELPFPDASFDAVRAERVIQHLERPAAGLREMIRVTRPGGRVVVIDADHGQGGLAVDGGVESRVFEACRSALLAMVPNPHAGIGLRALFARAGLSDLRQEIHPIEFTHEQFREGLFLHDRLATAIDSGAVTRREVEEFLASMERRAREGTFQSVLVAYTVAGTRSGDPSP